MRSLIFNISTILLMIFSVNRVGAASYVWKLDQRSDDVSYTKSKKSKTKVISSKRVFYKKPTTSVRSLRVISPSAIVVRKNGVNYYHHDGRYYRRDVDKYIAIVPPVGIKITRLPVGHQVVKLLGRTYYYHLGVYYSRVSSGYEVVAAPQDILVSSLPEDADIATIDGKQHYICNGYIYEVVIIPDGGKAFKVVGELEMN